MINISKLILMMNMSKLKEMLIILIEKVQIRLANQINSTLKIILLIHTVKINKKLILHKADFLK